MAKEILVTENLTDSMMNAGEKMLARLDQKDAEVESAFWMLFPEEKLWKLIIASPQVGLLGPRKYYRKIDEANELAVESETIVSLHDISAKNTTDQLVKLLKTAVNTKTSGIRFSRNAINGVFIEDAYILKFRVSDSVQSVEHRLN